MQGYLETRPLSDVRLSSFVFFVRPELYGIQAEPLPPLPAAPAILPARFNPSPGTYVISASTLRGLQLADPEMYNWFWHREPDDVVANAMLVHFARWVAFLGGDERDIGWIMSVGAVSAVFLRPWVGSWIDRLGPRRTWERVRY